MVSSRIQRWALTLSTYKYSIRYKAGRHRCNADALSRLPRPVSISNDHVPEDLVLMLNHLSSTSADAARIKEWTAKDPVMSRVLRYLTTGWPNQTPSKDYQPYFTRRDKLSSLDGCILVGSRIIIPPPGRQPILEELHETHPGTSKMKYLAHSYLWWPGIDTDIEQMVKTCPVCQQSHIRGNGHPNPGAEFIWTLHGKLIIIDAHSKWLDVHIMPSITTVQEKLSKFLFTYRITPQTTTGVAPAQLLMNRCPRSRLDRLFPDLSERVAKHRTA